MGRLITLTSLALLGFLVGAAGYFAYHLLTSVDFYGYIATLVTFVEPYTDVFTSPWFISGLVGSILTMVIAVTLSYVSHR